MDVYLLPLENDERCIFYSEEPEAMIEDAGADALSPRAGVRGLVERKFRRARAALIESEEGIGRHTRRAWEWLHKRVPLDETLLRRLRLTHRIRIYHPPAMTSERAAALWKKYLVRRGRRHLLWLVIDALVVPLTLLFTPVPGPNVIGYWFVYRAACHGLALMGVRRARMSETAAECVALPLLDGFAAFDDQQLAQLAAALKLRHCDALIKLINHEQARENVATVTSL